MSFGQFLTYMLLIWVWLGLISIWIFALVDLFRRHDLSGWAKAAWLLAIIVFPVIGTCVYLVTMPKDRYATQRVPSMAIE